VKNRNKGPFRAIHPTQDSTIADTH